MATVFEELFDGATDGTTITTTNVPTADSIAATAVFEDDAGSHIGLGGARITGTGGFIRWVVPNDFSCRMYPTISATSGASAQQFVQIGTSANGLNCTIRFHSSGVIDIANSSNTRQGAASTTTWAVNDRFRFDFQWSEASPGSATIDLRIFKGANIDGTTPDETLSRSITGFATATSRLRVRSNVTGWTSNVTAVKVTDVLEWIGPYVPPAPEPEGFEFWEASGGVWLHALTVQEATP